MTLRNRKNNKHLISEINNFVEGDDDDDEEAIFMKSLIAKQQSATTNSMIKRQLTNILVLVFVLGVSLFCLLRSSNGGVIRKDESGIMHSLSKALSILVGRKKRRARPSLAEAKIVASSTIPKSKINDLLYYTKWSFRAEPPIYLIPNTAEYTPIKDILRRGGDLRYYGIDIDLHDNTGMYQSLESINTGHINEESTRDVCLRTFEKLSQHHFVKAQRDLWIWCMLYSGRADGFMDIETYSFYLQNDFVRMLVNGLQNGNGQSGGYLIRGPSETDAIVFTSKTGSLIAKMMIEFLNELEDFNDIKYQSLYYQYLISLIHDKQSDEKWIVLESSCNERPMNNETKICPSKELCCKVQSTK